MSFSDNWKILHSEIINEIWNNQKNSSFGVCAVCPKCGESSMSFCQCAKQNFVDKLTFNEFQEYLKNKNPGNNIHVMPFKCDCECNCNNYTIKQNELCNLCLTNNHNSS